MKITPMPARSFERIFGLFSGGEPPVKYRPAPHEVRNLARSMPDLSTALPPQQQPPPPPQVTWTMPETLEMTLKEMVEALKRLQAQGQAPVDAPALPIQQVTVTGPGMMAAQVAQPPSLYPALPLSDDSPRLYPVILLQGEDSLPYPPPSSRQHSIRQTPELAPKRPKKGVFGPLKRLFGKKEKCGSVRCDSFRYSSSRVPGPSAPEAGPATLALLR